MGNEITDWRVLIADNSATMGRLIKNYLVGLGLKAENITLAGDGNQAYMITELMSFDLVTAGRHMKLKDGLELLSTIRKSEDKDLRDVRFLMISADGSPQLMADVLSAQGNGLLIKPFHPQDLSKTLSLLAEMNNGGFVCLDDRERYVDPSSQKNGAKPSKSEEVDDNSSVPSGVVDAFIQSTIEGLGQYMVQAQPDENSNGNCVDISGDLLSSIEISDPKVGVKAKLTLLFPKKAACTIYETLFGEVDLEMVCGIVGELNNIIAGAVKPRVAGFTKECFGMVFPGQDANGASSADLDFQLGFPEATWLTEQDAVPPVDEGPQFTVPFQLDEGQLFLRVSFHPV